MVINTFPNGSIFTESMVEIAPDLEIIMNTKTIVQKILFFNIVMLYN
jgi:hypothetical protein